MPGPPDTRGHPEAALGTATAEGAQSFGGGGLRCAAWSRQVSMRPHGTAGSPAGFVIVDWPLPWPADANAIEELSALGALARDGGLRLQLVAPHRRGGEAGIGPRDGVAGPGSPALPARPASILTYRHGPRGAFEGFVPDEATFAAGSGPGAVLALAGLLEHEAGTTAVSCARGQVLVCAHGRRDVCCGSAGTVLAGELAASSPERIGSRALGRTSHTGGHRFAPTVLVLPEGTLWARADADLLERVTNRRGSMSDVVSRYRGCAGLAGPELQTLEASVLAEFGWELFGRPRHGFGLGGQRWRLEVGGSSTAAWEGRVVVSRRLPLPECGQPPSSARKHADELVVTELTRIL